MQCPVEPFEGLKALEVTVLIPQLLDIEPKYFRLFVVLGDLLSGCRLVFTKERYWSEPFSVP